MSKFQGVLKMFMLGMLKTILKTVLKYKKKHHHTLRHVLKLIGRFRFSSSILHMFAMRDVSYFISLFHSVILKIIFHLQENLNVLILWTSVKFQNIRKCKSAHRWLMGKTKPSFVQFQHSKVMTFLHLNERSQNTVLLTSTQAAI